MQGVHRVPIDKSPGIRIHTMGRDEVDAAGNPPDARIKLIRNLSEINQELITR